jgi:hypothetical protein
MTKRCFVLTPFGSPFDNNYRRVLVPAIKAAALNPIRADEIYGSRPIIDDIFENIKTSEVLVADVTGKNPNVNYELGLAHAFGRPVVIISQSVADIPFDYRHLRAIIYNTQDTDWASQLREKVTKSLLISIALQQSAQSLERGTIIDSLVMLGQLRPLQGLDKKLAKAKKVKMCGWSLRHVVDECRHWLRERPPGCELQILLLDPDSPTVANLDNIITRSDPIAYKAQGWPEIVNTGVCSSDIRATIAILRENDLLSERQTVRLCNSLLPFGLILAECSDGEAWLTVQIYTLHPNLRLDRRLAFTLENKDSRLWALLEDQFDLAWEDPNFSHVIEAERVREERPASTGPPDSPSTG